MEGEPSATDPGQSEDDTTSPQSQQPNSASSYLDAAKSFPVPQFRITQHVQACDVVSDITKTTDEANLSVVDSQSQGTLTHHEEESVLSSWLDDDECFFAAAQVDAQSRVPTTQMPNNVPSPSGLRRAPSGSGRGNKRQFRQRPQKVSTPTANLSGGRFEALGNEFVKRRW